MANVFSTLVASIFGAVFGIFRIIFITVFLVIFGILAFFFIRYQFNPFHLEVRTLKQPYIRYKYLNLFRWLLVDFLERDKHRGEFREYGFTFYVGRQGAGKTISMVRYLEVMKECYPNCLLVTNFDYYCADRVMNDWRDLLTIRNGIDGVIFAIDEIHSEYDSSKWADIPEDLLSEISQQRKQRIKIIASAQFFGRVAKPLREQAVTVVACKTIFGRLTLNREYDSLEYSSIVDNPLVAARKIKPLRKSSFVQSDFLRSCYDTYAKVERMKKTKFIPRSGRGRLQ